MEVQRLTIHENKTEELEFSLDFHRQDQVQWMDKNWSISLYWIAGYLAFLYFGKEYMKNRKPFNLQNGIIIWNALLAAFSIAGCATVLPEFIGILNQKDGLHKSVCDHNKYVSDASMFWAWVFVLSKVVELGDTVFIVLRKKPLIFLHWYHHITVLLFCWYTYKDLDSVCRWFIVLNYFVHSLMYSYYALRAMHIKVPKPIAMTITLLQLSQMVVGVTVNVYSYQMIGTKVGCSSNPSNIQLALAMYGSYFVLFAHFFYKAYFSKSNRKPTTKAE